MKWPDFLRLRRLEGRIVALFLALLVLVQLTSWLITYANIRRSTEVAVAAELRTGQRMLDHLLAQAALQRVAVLRQLENNHGIRSVLAEAAGMPAAEFAETLFSALDSKNSHLLEASVIAYVAADFRLVTATRPQAEAFVALLPALFQAQASPDSAAERTGRAHLALVDARAYQ